MVTLRKIEPDDLPYLYQWENDAAAWEDGNNHNPLSQQDLRDYITNSTGDIYKDGQLRLIIMHENCTIGCIDLFDLDPRNLRAAIGMYIAPAYRGKGLGTAAVRALEDYTFGFLHLRTIYAVIAEKNRACRAIYAQLNYQPSTPLKNWTVEGDAIIYIKNNANRI